MKKPELEKLLGKKVGGPAGGRGGGHTASTRREQALARKRELLEQRQKNK
jgi:hypothetical protein